MWITWKLGEQLWIMINQMQFRDLMILKLDCLLVRMPIIIYKNEKRPKILIKVLDGIGLVV